MQHMGGLYDPFESIQPFRHIPIFAGVFVSVPSILDATIIADLFFLHERGRAFLVFFAEFPIGHCCRSYIRRLHCGTCGLVYRSLVDRQAPGLDPGTRVLVPRGNRVRLR